MEYNPPLSTSVWTFTRTASISRWPRPARTGKCATGHRRRRRRGGQQGAAPAGEPGERLHVVYEAGPCGFVLQRHLAALGYACEVVAPSLIAQALGRPRQDRPARRHDAGPPGARGRAHRGARARRGATRRCATWCAPARTPCASSATPPPAQGAAAAQRHRLQRAHLLDGGAPALAGQPDAAARRRSRSPSRSTCTPSRRPSARIARLEQALRDALPQWPLAPVVPRCRRCAACS